MLLAGDLPVSEIPEKNPAISGVVQYPLTISSVNNALLLKVKNTDFNI